MTISLLPGAHEMPLSPEKTVLQHCLENGISLPHACGGEGKCSTCRVAVLEGEAACDPRTAEEKVLAERFSFPPEIRLGCQLRVKDHVVLRRLILDDEDQTLMVGAPASLPKAVGVEVPMAVLFVDIRGFTTFSEQLLPYDIVHALNRYFFHMGTAVQECGGEINNYMGDGFMALFSKGDAMESCRQAVKAGLKMLEQMECVGKYFQSLHGRQFSIGIGIHYGEVIQGSIGFGETRRNTVIGDVVNFASRIESMTKEVGVPFLVSEAVYQVLKEEIEFQKKSEIAIRGKKGTYSLYEVLGKRSFFPLAQ